MKAAYRCEAEEHEGERTGIAFADRLELRHEYRRKDNDGRERTFKIIDICRPCARKRWPTRQPTNQTVPLFPSRAQA